MKIDFPPSTDQYGRMKSRSVIRRHIFKYFLLLCTLLTGSLLKGMPEKTALIPLPEYLQASDLPPVSFPSGLLVYIPSEGETDSPSPDMVREHLDTLRTMNFSPEIKETGDRHAAHVILSQFPVSESIASSEAYSLDIIRNQEKKGMIRISASASGGFFHAWQTLTSLLIQGKRKEECILPQLTIRDTPRFEWRGLHLDVSRHFFKVADVERLLDTMALFKLNTLHLHLTDGPGWRLEIKKYPELTKTGAWRVDKRNEEWNWPNTEMATPGETRPLYGGFYTQEELAHLIEFARKRNIKIVPEIDLPGHSYAALFSYRNLACKGNNVPIDGLKGKDVLCVGNPETQEFVRNVLDELMALFPLDTPIHIGGDEVSKDAWLNCSRCRERMKKENIKTGAELQSSFIRETMAYLKQKGREVIAWDEVYAEGIKEDCTIMAWHDDACGTRIAEAGCPVIFTPCSHLYFDYYQDAPTTEPKSIGGLIPLEKVFHYRPAEGISPFAFSRIRGIQGNLWTEHIKTPEHLEYMAWPRGMALAERAWSPPGNDYESFLRRLEPYLKLLSEKKINYRPLNRNREKGEKTSKEKQLSP